jgi:membrane protease YdiL (CAAX protease family)
VTGAPGSSSKPWKRFLVKDGRLRPIWRLALFLPMITVVYVHRQVLALVVVVVFLRHIDKRRISSLGFGLHRGWLTNVSIGVFLGAGLIGMIFVIELIFGWIDVKGFAWESRPDFANALAGAIVAMLFVAVSEETIFRGYILQNLEECFGMPTAVIVSSILFGAFHLFNPTATVWANYVIPFTLTLAGVMLAAAYLVRRSLWLPIALHFSWNICLYDIFGLAGAPADSATFLITDVKGPAFWIGLPHTAFGPEVGILSVIAALLGIVLLRLLWRYKGSGKTAQQVAGADKTAQP